MSLSSALLQRIVVMEKIQTEIAAIAKRDDHQRKHELIKLRCQLSEQVGRVSTAGDAVFGSMGAPQLVAEFRMRLSAMRGTIATHQARWPAVTLDSADGDFARSVTAARDATEAFISWTRNALKHRP